MTERGPLLNHSVTVEDYHWPSGRVPFRFSALMFAGAALEIAKALHRIAAEMERRNA